METTLQRQSIKQDLIILLAVTAMVFAGYRSTTVPYYMPTSMIEDGEIVVRNDSVTTVVIKDKR